MAEYEARRVDLRTLSMVAGIYGMREESDAIYDESCSGGGNGPGMTAGQMAVRIKELGLPVMLHVTHPDDPPDEVVRATIKRWVFLARIKGYGRQDSPVWGVAEWRFGVGVGIMIHMPTDIDLTTPAPFAESWTGEGIVIRKDHGYGSLT